MNRFLVLAVLSAFAILPAYAGASEKASKSKGEDVSTALALVPLPELPAKVSDLIREGKAQDREAIALASVQFIGSEHPAMITPVVSTISAILPASASTVALAATKAVPDEATAISDAAVRAAPAFAEQIERALGAGKGGNRPKVPPGLEGKTNPGTIHGNRPSVPPGHVRDPKPGREPQGRNYGRP